MSNVVEIRLEFLERMWKMQFADCVLAICPEVNPDAADEASDTEVIQFAGEDPAAAARRWVAKRFESVKEVR
jgi:hypothetical protein